WESLFSTGEQELTFRLSLRLATFLEDHNARRETLFDECKDVYSIRSKVIHGAAIDRNSEQAAIHLVESVVPSAEKLARRALVKIFEMGLESIFNNPSKISALFNKLLFSSSL